MPKPNAATRQWAGKTDRKNPADWVPFKGKWKLIKLPPNEGVTPEMTEGSLPHRPAEV